jgi:hypothetical protein
MNKNKNITIGLVLVALGIFLIVQKTIGLDIEVWSFIWPLFLLIPGITMHISYFSKDKNSRNLAIAGILTIYGGLFLFNTLTNNAYNDKLTFIYFLGIAIGFFENYIFGNKRNSDLSVTLIFLIIAFIIFLKDVFPNLNYLRDYILPSILIIFGVYVLIKRRD